MEGISSACLSRKVEALRGVSSCEYLWRSRSRSRHAVAEDELSGETKTDELRLEAVAKSGLDLFSR